MRVVICGSRSITNYDLVKQAIEESGFKITEVVCGMAKGADMLGWRWAKMNNVPIKEMPADWDDLDTPDAVIKKNKSGKSYNARAGLDRNTTMLDYAGPNGGVIAVWNGSGGTKDTINKANKRRMKVFVKRVV